MAVQPLTKAAYAVHRGCSAAYVSKLIRLGKLAPPALLPDGRIDPELADAQVAGSRERAVEKPAELDLTALEGAGGDSLVEHRKAMLRAQLSRLERENAIEEGRLVDRRQVEDEQETAARTMRDAMLRVPHEVAERLAQTDSADQVVILLRQAIERALEDAARLNEEAASAAEREDAGPGAVDGP